jgi:sugar phosphate isomerase/epimerase
MMLDSWERGWAMFASLNTGHLRINAPLEEEIALAARHGFAALDLDTGALLRRSADTPVEEMKDHFAAAGIRAGAWGLPVEFRAEEERYRSGLEALPRHAALAQALGSTWCSTWIRPFSDTLNFDENMAVHVRRLGPVARILADHGCRFGLEFVAPVTVRRGHPHPFIHTIDGALELAARLGTGNVGLLLDSYHWHTAHGTRADIERLRADQVVYVHLNDAHPGIEIDELPDTDRLLPGASGVIDITGFLHALARSGYQGPMAVEPFNAALEALPIEERVRRTAESVRACLTRAGLPWPG